MSKRTFALVVTTGVLQSVLLVGGVVAFWWFSRAPVACCAPPVAQQQPPEAYSAYTGEGITKQQATQRAFGVMISGDAITRPQSGLGLADVVVEMEAATGITRFLALFQSVLPTEIGSIRSVRNDYIDLAEGFDAPIVHWGGEKRALDRLAANPGINNIDQFANGDLFFRKPGIPGPHDGFTTGDYMQAALKRFSYNRAPTFTAWTFKEGAAADQRPVGGTLTIPYGNPTFDVRYEYDPTGNTYLRSQGGAPHKEKLTGEQIAPSNVLVVRANYFVYSPHGGYLQYDIAAGGTCTLYQDGQEIPCRWKKGKETSPLVAVGVDGAVLPLVRGKTWIEVVLPSADVLWKVATPSEQSTTAPEKL